MSFSHNFTGLWGTSFWLSFHATIQNVIAIFVYTGIIFVEGELLT